jgi:hypothetical protein
MVTHRVYNWCNQSETVTSELAKDPSQCPWKIFKDLYETHDHILHPKKSVDGVRTSSDEVSSAQEKDQLQKALSCGNWGSSVPSELFLKVRMIQPLPMLRVRLDGRMC